MRFRLEIDRASLQNLEASFRELIEQGCQELRNRCVRIVEEAKVLAPVDTGNLKQNIGFMKTGETEIPGIGVFDTEYGIGYAGEAFYGRFVEFGTGEAGPNKGPYWPRVYGRLMHWADRKGLNPWAVRYYIYRYGTKPYRPITGAASKVLGVEVRGTEDEWRDFSTWYY